MDKIPYKSSSRLGEGNVTHAFLGRLGGKSPSPFASLNISTAVGDEAQNVSDNIELLSHHLGFRAKNLTTVKQVHGNEIVVVFDDTYSGALKTEADAIITDKSFLPIGVLTADCVPIILHDPVKRAIGVVHAGWRGTLSGIAGDTIEAMRAEFDSEPGDILAAIGPAIGSCCFEVGDEIIQDFIKKHPGSKTYLNNSHIDLTQVNSLTLLKSGLSEKNIDKLDICTVCDKDNYFSHRRDGSADATGTGRQLSFIMLKKESC